MKKFMIPKLIGLTILVMMVLVLISIGEVAVYSYAINPRQEISVYDAHAELSAPYISGIFGFIIFFLISRYWKRKGFSNAFQLALLFPLVYVIVDMIIILAATGEKWKSFVLIFVLANGAKFLGSYLGHRLTN